MCICRKTIPFLGSYLRREVLGGGHCWELSPNSDCSSWTLKTFLKNRNWAGSLLPTHPAPLQGRAGTKERCGSKGNSPHATDNSKPGNSKPWISPGLGFASLVPVETASLPHFVSPTCLSHCSSTWHAPRTLGLCKLFISHSPAFNCSSTPHNPQQQHLKLPGTSAAPQGFEG